MKKQIKKEDKDVVPGYMGTFADMVTLLMAFFVLLYAMSDPDPGKFEDFSEAMHEELSGEEIESEFEELTNNLQEIIDEKEISDKVGIELTPKGIEIQMEGKALFDGCSADIKSDMKHVISNISTAITDLLNNVLPSIWISIPLGVNSISTLSDISFSSIISCKFSVSSLNSVNISNSSPLISSCIAAAISSNFPGSGSDMA